jgi:hypothetical protein
MGGRDGPYSPGVASKNMNKKLGIPEIFMN